MTITSLNPTYAQLPDEGRQAGRSEITWAEEAYRAHPDPPPRSRHQPTGRSFRRLVVVIAAGAVCVGTLAVTAGSVSAPRPSATTSARSHPRDSAATAQPGRPGLLQCATAAGTKATQRLFLPVLQSFPCPPVPGTHPHEAAGEERP